MIQGIYLVYPHGRLIIYSLKSHIVKKINFRNLVEVPLVLVENNLALAIIELDPPVRIDYKEFLRTYNLHQVTEEEAKKWWDDFDFLYLYPVKILFRFKRPIRVNVPRGVQTFIKDVVEVKPYLPDWLLERFKQDFYLRSEAKKINEKPSRIEQVRTIIKEIMDYGEFEEYYNKLKSLLNEKRKKGEILTKTIEGNYIDQLVQNFLNKIRFKNFITMGNCGCNVGDTKFLCIDADNTIFEEAPFPLVGKVKSYMRLVLQDFKNKGYRIIIWSSRNSAYNQPFMRALAMNLLKVALDLHNLPYDLIDWGNSGKIVCDYYIDDRNIKIKEVNLDEMAKEN